MKHVLRLSPREQHLALELLEALSSSLDLPEALARGHSPLFQLFRADSGEVCVSIPEAPGEREWAAAALPREWFETWARLERRGLAGGGPGAAGWRRPWSSRRREPDPPRHALSVLLPAGAGWRGGVTLYRERRPRPFSDRDQALLRRLAPSLANALRNCKRFGLEARRAAHLEGVLGRLGMEVVVVAPQGGELSRTSGATALLRGWFPPGECGPGTLPPELSEPLAPGARAGGRRRWERAGPARDLRVTFLPFPGGEAPERWAAVLQEVAHAPEVPPAWRRRLTPQEGEVVSRVLSGWSNRLISEDLRCAVNTVKKHLQRVYDKLGVSSRSQLLHLAAWRS